MNGIIIAAFLALAGGLAGLWAYNRALHNRLNSFWDEYSDNMEAANNLFTTLSETVKRLDDESRTTTTPLLKLADLDIAFNEGDIVYLKTDLDADPRMVIGFEYCYGRIRYELTSGTKISYHNAEEITRNKTYVLSL